MSTELVHLNPETMPLSRQIVTVQCDVRSADRRTRRDCLRATSPAVQSGPRFQTGRPLNDCPKTGRRRMRLA